MIVIVQIISYKNFGKRGATMQTYNIGPILCHDIRRESGQSFLSLLKKDNCIITYKEDKRATILKQSGYCKSNLISTFNEEKLYSPYDIDIWAKDEFQIRNEIEKQMHYNGDVTYIASNFKKTEAMLRRMPVTGKYWSYEDIQEPIVLSGFEYFGGYADASTEFILAMKGSSIIGVIAYNTVSKQNLIFIDVHYLYRGKGIASGMMRKLKKHLNLKEPLFVTEESSLGKICQIHSLLHRYTCCKICTF